MMPSGRRCRNSSETSSLFVMEQVLSQADPTLRYLRISHPQAKAKVR